MSERTAASTLDETVATIRAELEERRVPAPDVLFLLATGGAPLLDQIRHAREVPLSEIEAVPPPWSSQVLHAGGLGSLGAWILEDRAGEPAEGELPPWAGGLFPWIAAASGATVCVHVSAGSGLSLDGVARAPVGGLALVRDHINASGATPLAGLGASSLGPLFPDLSHLHHLGLRRAALEHAERLAIPASEAVCACTAGPSLETPAERRMLALLGADVCVQSLAGPLLAAGHAGLSMLALVVVTDASDGPVDVVGLLEAVDELAPRLDELLPELVPDLERAVAALHAGSR